MPSPPRPRRHVSGWAVVSALVALALAYLAVTGFQVWRAGIPDGVGHADAIVVLGAAQYDGVPSPALQQRLDHAVGLYRDDVAPIVVVTGGYRPGDRFTEATAAATYLHQHGVPDPAIRREVQGRNTWEQLAATARFLQVEGVTQVVLVSHPAHARRVQLVAREVGLEPSVSATPGRHDPGQILRETVAIAVGQIIGFRRLANLKPTMPP